MNNTNQLRASYDRFNEAGRQITALQNRIKELEETISAATRRIMTAEDERKGMLARHMAGGATQADIDASSEEMASLRRTIDDAKEMVEAGGSQATVLDGTRRAAGLEYARERENYCQSLSAPIENKLRTDSKIRRQLIDVYAAAGVGVSDSRVALGAFADWDLVLHNIFLPPDETEYAEACARFKLEHIFPVLGEDAP